MDKLEKAYQTLIDYENEVKNFLLRVCGTNSINQRGNWIDSAFSTYSKLEQCQTTICCYTLSVIYDAMFN